MPTESAALPLYDLNRTRFVGPETERLEDTHNTATKLALPESQSHSTLSETERSGVFPSFTIDFHCKIVS